MNSFNDGTDSALKYIEPGTVAFVYVEGSILQDIPASAAPVKAKTGWSVADGLNLSHFKLAKSGKIQTFQRNGVLIDKSVVPGNGEVYTARPGEYDSWTGVVTGTVHSFRYFDGDLRAILTTDNQSSDDAEFSFNQYAADGKQYTNIYSDRTLPGLKRATIASFEGAKPGGTVYASIITGGSGQEFTIDVPKFG